MEQIAVVGSLNLDRRVEVPHIIAPGETLMASEPATISLGGKGANQAVAVHQLGANATFAGAIGADDAGRWATRVLREHGLDAELTLVEDQLTGQATIMVDPSGENAILVEQGANRYAPQEFAATSAVHTADVVITQLETSLGTAAAAMDAARQRGAVTILNAAPAPTRWSEQLRQTLRVTDVLVVNEIEASQLVALATDAGVGGLSGPESLTRLGPATVVVTLGPGGIAAWHNDGPPVRVPATRVKVVDSAGAGDACTAGIAVGLARGWELTDALALGNACGAHVVQRTGTFAAIASLGQVNRPAP